MGTSISKKLEEQQKNNDEKAVEELQMLQEMMVNKVAAARAEIREKALKDANVPIVAFVDTSEKYSVDVSNAPDDAITTSIKEMFGGNIIQGLVSLIGVALNQFLVNTQAGVSEQNDYHIVFSDNALLRIDVMFYKYEFSSKGVEDERRNGFCYCTQAAVLDLKKVSPEVLLYELTRTIGQENIPDAVKQLHLTAEFGEQLYQVVNELTNAAKKPLTDSDDGVGHKKEIRNASEEEDDEEHDD
ncbi:unnamed protein product [Pocillopora meandrina]|uniref:Uncharacterized protein n=1 Tax=Pocillopora meandrina TaxID=46732 RepID=A0AAU9WXK1_9CNID|nr:unnamed protein product [Pocillopora meandrina]